MTLLDTTESVHSNDNVVLLELVIDSIGDWTEWITVLDITESVDRYNIVMILGLVVKTEKRLDISNKDRLELLLEHAVAFCFFYDIYAFILLYNITVEF
jgi:hypothetical protein